MYTNVFLMGISIRKLAAVRNDILSVKSGILWFIGLISGLLFLFTHSVSAQVANQNEALIEFMAGQGCAIGPSTKAAARVAGFTEQDIDRLSDSARADPDTVKTGDWLVLSSEACEIELPRISSQLRLNDLEVDLRISAVDAYAAEGSHGCFFNRGNIFEHLAVTRGWDENTVALEYIRMLGAALVSGDFALFGENALALPRGFLLTKGACAELPNMPRIKQNRELLVQHFDALIRANAQHVVCEAGASLSTPEFHEIANNITNNMNSNEWLWSEIQIIAMGAGWYEGLSGSHTGTPCPPLCHFDEPPQTM